MKKLTLERTYNATADWVWKAFTSPDILKLWWSPIGMSCSYASIVLEKGGLFHYCFKGEDGNEFWGRGIYQTIEAPNRISYLDTFSDKDGNPVAPSYYGIPDDKVLESLIEITFSEEGKLTNMVITMDNHYDDSMTNQMMEGWNEMFDKLDKLIHSDAQKK